MKQENDPMSAYRHAHYKLDLLCESIANGPALSRVPAVMDYNGKRPTWEDVAVLLTAVDRLTEIDNMINGKGEYAK